MIKMNARWSTTRPERKVKAIRWRHNFVKNTKDERYYAVCEYFHCPGREICFCGEIVRPEPWFDSIRRSATKISAINTLKHDL